MLEATTAPHATSRVKKVFCFFFSKKNRFLPPSPLILYSQHHDARCFYGRNVDDGEPHFWLCPGYPDCRDPRHRPGGGCLLRCTAPAESVPPTVWRRRVQRRLCALDLDHPAPGRHGGRD